MAKEKKKRVNGNRKGKTAERKLVPLFAAWWGSEFFRTPESGGMSTRLTKMLKIDLSKFAGDIVTLDETFPFCIESKKVEGWTLEQLLTSDKTLIHSWWDQAVKQTPEGKIPLLVFTKNHAPLYAMMRTSDLPSYVYSTRRSVGPSFETYIEGVHVAIFALSHLLATTKGDWL